MKKVNTTVSTGDVLFCADTNRFGTVGTIKHGEIKISFKINETSCFSEYYTVRKLNQLLKLGLLQLI